MTKSPWAQLRSRLHLANTRWQRWAAGSERRRRRQALQAYSPSITAGQAAIDPNGLARTGFSQARLDPVALQALLQAWAALDAAAERAGTRGAQKRNTGKAFFRERLDEEALARHPAFVDMALSLPVLASAAAAMGQVPHFESVDIIESIPGTGAAAASQLWHYDVNDERIVKLFVYLEDCGPENGPFTFIEAGPSQRVTSAVGHYVPDEAISQHVPASQWRTVEGPAGTAFLIDTGRCYHFGSRCTSRRVAFIATYSSGLKFMPRSRLWPHLLHGRTLDPLQRAVCGIAE